MNKKNEDTNPDDHLRTTSTNLWSSKNIWGQNEVLCRDSLQEAQDKFDYINSTILYIHPDEYSTPEENNKNFETASRIWVNLVFLIYKGGAHTLRLLKVHYRNSYNPDMRERAVLLMIKTAEACKSSSHEYRILYEILFDDLITISLMDRNSEIRATAFRGYLTLASSPRDAAFLIADMLCHDISTSQRLIYLNWREVQDFIKDRDVGFCVWNAAHILLNPKNTPHPLSDEERAGLIRVINTSLRKHPKHKKETDSIIELFRKSENQLIRLAIEEFDSL